MSRSGYSDDCDGWELIRWRGAVASAIRGKRGQAFLREMATALDAMPVKRLVAEALQADGEVCAMGAVGAARGIDMSAVNPEAREQVAATFGVSEALVAEIAFMNDDDFYWEDLTPEKRWERMRKWVDEQIAAERAASGEGK